MTRAQRLAEANDIVGKPWVAGGLKAEVTRSGGLWFSRDAISRDLDEVEARNLYDWLGYMFVEEI